MTSKPAPSNSNRPWRSWSWVSKNTFSPTPFYQRSWQILKADWLVFVWKILADFAVRIVTALIPLLVALLFIADFQISAASGIGLFDWIDRALHIPRSPAFVAGLIGLFFFVSLFGAALQALVVGGIWGLLERGLRQARIDRFRTFWTEALEQFPRVLSLFLLRFALRVVTALMLIAIVVGFFRASSSPAFQEAPILIRTALISGGVTIFLAWAGLTRLAVEVVGAPMIIDGVDLGEAVLRGSVFALDNFWSLYRLLIFALGILLIPLGLYWALIMFDNLSLIWPVLGPLGTAGRLFGEVVLWVSISAVGVFFYGALFAFYATDDESRVATAERSDHSPKNGDDTNGHRRDLDAHTELADLVPRRAPNRFHVDELLAPEERPFSEDDDEPGDDEPGDDKPGDDKSGDDKPGDGKPGDDKPGDDKPGDDKPGDDKPGDDGDQSGDADGDRNRQDP